MRLFSSIIIHTHPQEVYRFVALHPQNMKKWMKGFSHYEHQKGRKRREGSTGIQVFDENGHITRVQEEVLANEPHSRLVLKLTHKNMSSELEYQFLDQGGQHTKLLVTARVRLKPSFFNLFSLFVKSPMQRQQDEDLGRLKRVMEG